MKIKILLFPALLMFIINSNVSCQEKSWKRGVSYGYHSPADMAAISPFISWWYNWSAVPDAAIKETYGDYGVDFAAMAWNHLGISAVRTRVEIDEGIKYILGFNEPNFLDQANMTPGQAAAAWPSFQAIADDYGIVAVGPAVNYCGDCVSENGTVYNDPWEYLDDFFSACTGCQVDHIAIHWYGGGNSITSMVNDARKYNKPIWVTEFAAWDNSVTGLSSQKNYLAGTVNFLERDPDIFRYSWFVGRTSEGPESYPYIDLYGADGMLTELGRLYADIPVYDPMDYFTVPGRIECEEYYRMSGLFGEITTDVDGFMNLGWTDTDDWATYKINVSESGNYNFYARAAASNAGVLELFIDGISAGTINIPATGGWQNWTTVSSELKLTAGGHILKFLVKDPGFNLNWFNISAYPLEVNSFQVFEAEVFPNPVTNGIINLKLKRDASGGNYRITIINPAGKIIHSGEMKIPGNTFQLKTDDCGIRNPGVYFIRVEGNNCMANSKIFII